MTKGTKPVWHLLKARDGTGIITEENTTECSKSSLLRENKRMRKGPRKARRGYEGQTIRTPASLFLGALAPMPPPIATGPPGMTNESLGQGFVWGLREGNGRREKSCWERHIRGLSYLCSSGWVLSVMFGLNGQFGSTVETLLTHTPPLRIWAMDIRGYGV